MNSLIELGSANLPPWAGTRIMHMPFKFDDVGTLPQAEWRECIDNILDQWPCGRPSGTGYITIDQKIVQAGKTHRRPGTHVDGCAARGWGGGGGWGGNNRGFGPPPRPFGSSGFIVASSHHACDAWNCEVDDIGDDGQCETPPDDGRINLKPNTAYWLAPRCPHQPLAVFSEIKRTFLRLSAPNDCPWFEGYTENPNVPPAGPIFPRRNAQMDWDKGED